MVAWLKVINPLGIWLQLRAIAEMRARAAWTKASSSRMRLLLFVLFLAYCVWLAYSSGMMGIALGIMALRRPDSIVFLSRILLVVFTGAVTASIIWGTNVLGTMDRRSLRAYPLSSFSRFWIWHFSQIMTPVWIASGIFILTVLGGMAFSRGRGAAIALLATGLLFIWFYQGAVLLKYVLAFVSRHFIGAGVAILAFSVGAMFAAKHWNTIFLTQNLAGVLRRASDFTPISEALKAVYFSDFKVLFIPVGWIAAEGLMLMLLGMIVPISTTVRAVTAIWTWDLAPVGASPLWIMVNKSLRYHLQCNRIRLGVIQTPIVLCAFVHLIGRRMSAQGMPFGTFAACFIMAFLITRPMTLNHFGYDGEGLTRYAILPLPFSRFLLADSIASVILGISVGLTGVGFLIYENSFPLSLASVLFMLLLLLDGAVFFNTVGLITSTFSPRQVTLSKIFGNDMSFGGNLVLYLGFAIPFFACFYFADFLQFELIVRYWWLALVTLPLFGAFAAAVWVWISRKVDVSREQLLKSVAL